MTQIHRLHEKELRKRKTYSSLFIIPEYNLLLVAIFLLSCVFIVPFIFIHDWLTLKGFTEKQISIVLLMNGIFSGLSRLLVGIIANLKCLQTIPFLLFWLGLSGVFTIISTYFTKPWEYAIYSAVDGLCCGAYSVLQPLVLVEILSTDHVTKGLGVLLFVCGIGYLFGAPILALVYDHWKSYEFCYGICGSVCLIASFLVLIMWLVSFRKLRLEKAELQLKRNLEMSSHLYCRGESDCSSVSATELNYMV
ncbi:unnamed protein product [Heterobilharzia americana]|nr:unnamed protein product [Heterobilharzia americana]